MENAVPNRPAKQNRAKFLIGGLLILAAIVYLIVSSTTANAQYFLTIEELQQKAGAMNGHEARVSGAVVGDSIAYDSENLTLTSTVADVPADNADIEAQGGLAAVLHAAVEDPSRARMQVVYYGVKPDLLKHEAQAIMTGKMGEDGIFYANELFLKCPTKYEEAVPDQSGG